MSSRKMIRFDLTHMQLGTTGSLSGSKNGHLLSERAVENREAGWEGGVNSLRPYVGRGCRIKK